MERKKTGDDVISDHNRLCDICIKHLHLEKVTSISAGLSECSWYGLYSGLGMGLGSCQTSVFCCGSSFNALLCWEVGAAPNWFPPASGLNCGKDSARELALWGRNMGIL